MKEPKSMGEGRSRGFARVRNTLRGNMMVMKTGGVRLDRAKSASSRSRARRMSMGKATGAVVRGEATRSKIPEAKATQIQTEHKGLEKLLATAKQNAIASGKGNLEVDKRKSGPQKDVGKSL